MQLMEKSIPNYISGVQRRQPLLSLNEIKSALDVLSYYKWVCESCSLKVADSRSQEVKECSDKLQTLVGRIQRTINELETEKELKYIDKDFVDYRPSDS